MTVELAAKLAIVLWSIVLLVLAKTAATPSHGKLS